MGIKETIFLHGFGTVLFSLDQVKELNMDSLSIWNEGKKNRAELMRIAIIVAKVVKGKCIQIQQGKDITNLASNLGTSLLKTAIYYQIGRLKSKGFKRILLDTPSESVIETIYSPLLEEYFFRRILQAIISEKINGKFTQNPILGKFLSVFLTSLAFSLIHVADEMGPIVNRIRREGLNKETVAKLAKEIFSYKKTQLTSAFFSGFAYELAKNISGLPAAIVMHSAHNHNASM